jgi:hypothetical protein
MTDTYPPIFELDEVATIVGMPKSLAKNWTIGRPLKITASVRSARGKGSRNLFSLIDVFKMALAYEMSEAGLSVRLIQRVLEQFENVISFDLNKALLDKSALDEDFWLIIGSSGDDVGIELHSKEARSKRTASKGMIVHSHIDLKSLAEKVFKHMHSLNTEPTQADRKAGSKRKRGK